MANLNDLQQTLGYTFKEPELLLRALTHSSFLVDQPEGTRSYERLEFLGDAVLGMVLAEALFEAYPNEEEGFLAQARSTLAKGTTLTRIARELQLGDYLRLGGSEEVSGGHNRASTLEDVFEAIVGAIYIDSGFREAQDFILRIYGDISVAAQKTLSSDNPKGKLQEWAQARDAHKPPVYTLLEESGPPHDRSFTAQVSLSNGLTGSGTGHSKKEAEENAAREVLEQVS